MKYISNVKVNIKTHGGNVNIKTNEYYKYLTHKIPILIAYVQTLMMTSQAKVEVRVLSTSIFSDDGTAKALAFFYR